MSIPNLRTVPLSRRRKRTPWWLVAFHGWMIVAGAAAGIMLGAIVINQLWPGHPIYLELRGFLQGILEK